MKKNNKFNKIVFVVVILTVIVGIGLGIYFITRDRNLNEGATGTINNNSNNKQSKNAEFDEQSFKNGINEAIIEIAKKNDNSADGYYARFYEIYRRNNGNNIEVYVWAKYGTVNSEKEEVKTVSMPLKLVISVKDYSMVSNDVPAEGENYKEHFSIIEDKIEEFENSEIESKLSEKYVIIVNSQGSTVAKRKKDENENVDQEKIAEFEKLFLKKLSTINEKTKELEDYKVEDIEIVEGEEREQLKDLYREGDTLARVTYSVKPVKIEGSNWIAGNGEVSNGWVVNKTSCECIRNGELINTTSFNTGW